MIINETLNYNESVHFLLSMRKTVSTVVSNSKKLTEVQRVELKNFILNEASDYEVMHLAMKGTLPQEKFNVNEEFMLFSELKEKVLMNYDVISTILDEQDLSIFLAEVGPVYPTFTTAKPVLELYLAEKDDEKPEQLSGPNTDDEAISAEPKKGLEKVADKAAQHLKKTWEDWQKANADQKAALKAKFEREKEEAGTDTVSAFEKLKNKAGQFVKDTTDKYKAARKERDEELHGKPETRFKDTKAGSAEDHAAADAKVKRDEMIDKAHEKVKKGVDYAKGKYEEAKDKVMGKKDIETGERGRGLKDDARDKAEELAKAAKEKGGEAVEKTRAAIKQHAPEVQAKAKEAGEAIMKKGGEAVDKVKQVAKQPLKDTGDQIHQAASGAMNKAGEFVQGHQTALAATALAGMAAYGASKIYKRFFSQAARACSGKSGPAKDACMKQFKMKAVQAKITALTRSKATCKKAKNPQKCMAAIDAQIQKARTSGGK